MSRHLAGDEWKIYSHQGAQRAATLTLNKAQKRQGEILEVACQLFLERGYDAVSLDDILERVGGSKTTLYSYYGGKEGLFAAAVHKACADKMAPLVAMNVVALDPRSGLQAIGRQFVHIISDPVGRSFFRAMIAEAHRFPELASTFFESGPQTTIRVLRRHIESWQKRKLLRSGNAEIFAVQFLGLIMGNFHLKNLLGIMKPLTARQIEGWVARGTEIFLDGTLVRKT